MKNLISIYLNEEFDINLQKPSVRYDTSLAINLEISQRFDPLWNGFKIHTISRRLQ